MGSRKVTVALPRRPALYRRHAHEKAVALLQQKCRLFARANCGMRARNWLIFCQCATLAADLPQHPASSYPNVYLAADQNL